MVHTLYYPKEIHEAKNYGKSPGKELKKQELELAEQFAKALLKPFHPDQFHDTYAERVEQLIESKTKGKPAPQREKATKMAPVVDLMSALQKSLADAHKSTAGKSQPARPRKLRKTA